MKINFKISDDKLSCEISHDDNFIGRVRLNMFKGVWGLEPAFKVPYGSIQDTKKYFDSSYDAGKDLVRIYRAVSPSAYTDEDHGDFGFNLNDVLTFLKTGD